MRPYPTITPCLRNYKTLHDGPVTCGVRIRDEFIKFYPTHYSANRMRLVVPGRESLDNLEAWVGQIFAKVPNKKLGQNRWDAPVYTEKELLTQTFATPVLESQSLIRASIRVPYGYKVYESQPPSYLDYLLGHEGPGGILALLRAKGWVSELGAGGCTLCPGSGLSIFC